MEEAKTEVRSTPQPTTIEGLCAEFFNKKNESLAIAKSFLSLLENAVLPREYFGPNDHKLLFCAVFIHYKRMEKDYEALWNDFDTFLHKCIPASEKVNIYARISLLERCQNQKDRTILVDKFRHYCQYFSKKDNLENPVTFADYYLKADLNRVITHAKKKRDEAFSQTFFGKLAPDSEKEHYDSHLKLVLSLKSQDDLYGCIRALLNYFHDDVSDMRVNSYSHFLMLGLVRYFDRQAKNEEFATKFKNWVDRKYDLNRIKGEFCAELRMRYFDNGVYSDSGSESGSELELQESPKNW